MCKMTVLKCYSVSIQKFIHAESEIDAEQAFINYLKYLKPVDFERDIFCIVQERKCDDMLEEDVID